MNNILIIDNDFFSFNAYDYDVNADQASFYDCVLKKSMVNFKKDEKFECIDVDFKKKILMLHDEDQFNLHTIYFSWIGL